MLIRLHPNGWKAIANRLNDADKLVESVTDYDAATIEQVATALIQGWDGVRLDTDAADGIDETVADAVLFDCIAGSVWVADASEQDIDDSHDCARAAYRELAAALDQIAVARHWRTRPILPRFRPDETDA